MKHRPVAAVVILGLFTFGLYFVYWFYATKEEMNQRGAEIPSFFYAWIPFVGIWWMWRFSKGVEAITERMSALTAFVLLFFAGIIGAAVIQTELNHLAEGPEIPEARVVS